jgi:hypothetical protein
LAPTSAVLPLKVPLRRTVADPRPHRDAPFTKPGPAPQGGSGFTDPPRKRPDLQRIPASPPNGNTLGTGRPPDSGGDQSPQGPGSWQVTTAVSCHWSMISGSRVTPPGPRLHTREPPGPIPASPRLSRPVHAEGAHVVDKLATPGLSESHPVPWPGLAESDRRPGRDRMLCRMDEPQAPI